MTQLVTKLLDHGFVRLSNLAGPIRRPDAPFDADDTDPARTARISFDNLDLERTREQDLKLYEYLMAHLHNTPIEMIETWWEMKLPIFLARQFVRHRTATINEVSGRYAILPAEWYIPEVIGGKPTNGAKQGQEDNLSAEDQEWFRTKLDVACASNYEDYLESVNRGVAPEHARMFLHVNHYTHWIWKQDLSNLMHFLSLRLDAHAQIEARAFSKAMYDWLKVYLPVSMQLFDEYRRK